MPSPPISSEPQLLPSRRTLSRRRCAHPATSDACASSSSKDESATRNPRTLPPLTPRTSVTTAALQLLIFAPNHAAAARAHGSWRPLPAARQFAPVCRTCQPPSAPQPCPHPPPMVLIPRGPRSISMPRPQEMPIAGTRAHAAMLRSRLASPILQHSPAQERRKLVFG